ncbi:HTH_Tnp_Tc3_2 domain-containing protein [Trichonephila clavipes]|nr:HTH_Tnp_Tc3_2 domain-containing protein [Trichonephila clavipes]
MGGKEETPSGQRELQDKSEKQVGRIDVSAAPRSERYGSCSVLATVDHRVYRRGGSGRPRNTNDREDRAIRRVATSAPTTSLASIQRHLPPSRHPVPSRETIRRRLTEVGLRSRRPLRRLPLTPHHRQCRLDFCRPRASSVVWSVSSSVTHPDSVSVLMTTAHVSGGAPASGPIRHLLSSGIQQFQKV